MVIEQSITIPNNHRIMVDIPPEFPEGELVTVLVLAPGSMPKLTQQRTPKEAIEYCWGLGERVGSRLTSDRLLAIRREDNVLED
jgi:hypothetical protein